MLARVEERLAAQRKEIQAAINAIANSIALLSGQAVPATGGRSVVLPVLPALHHVQRSGGRGIVAV